MAALIKKTTQKLSKNIRQQKRVSIHQQFMAWLSSYNARLTERYQSFLSRRPHRTLKRTLRRDYMRSLKLPGFLSFTRDVTLMLVVKRRTFLSLVGLFSVLLIFTGAITSQDTYTQINTLLKDSSKDLFGSGMGKVGQAGLLALSAFATWPSNLSVGQQICVALLLLYVWLSTVWLCREFMLGRRPRLRDGLYNAGAPIISSIALVGILIVQLLPVGIVALVYAALSSVGLLDGGFGNMLFWVFAAAVAALCLYWITSTAIALVIVTLPGMYPFRAIRAAGDLVIGRRLRILYRLLWGLFIVLMAWAVIMIPVILLDTGIKSTWSTIQNIPIVPYVGAVLSAASLVWMATYVYLFYRRIVDDNAKPA